MFPQSATAQDPAVKLPRGVLAGCAIKWRWSWALARIGDLADMAASSVPGRVLMNLRWVAGHGTFLDKTDRI